MGSGGGGGDQLSSEKLAEVGRGDGWGVGPALGRDIRLSVVRVSNAAKYGKSRNFLPDQLFPLKYGKKT